MSVTVLFHDSVRVALTRLFQWNVYEGLLEGAPTRAGNAASIRRYTIEAQQLLDEPIIHVIEPPEEVIPVDQFPSSRRRMYERRGHTPTWIPPIACAARFWHHQPIHDQHMHASRLGILWFQGEFALPIAPEILAQMKEMVWAKFARDCEHE